VAFYAGSLLQPMIVYDDFDIVARSVTWKRACDHLWLTQNEHAMPLGRLSTWALLQLAGRPTAYPQVIAFQGPLALLVALVLLARFVQRELGHPLYTLLVLVLFGVTSVYYQAVGWFAASFSVLALDMFLLALLAAQRWRKSGRLGWLLLGAGWTALAPGWFASGVLAGPLCCLYLLPSAEERHKQREASGPSWWRWPTFYGLRLVPLLGTLAFLAFSLPRTTQQIMHLPHYDGRTALESFDPLIGVLNTCRSLVDNLTLGVCGISGVACPRFLLPVILALLTMAAYWCGRPLRERRLLWLGLGLILVNYLLVYSARAAWPYDGNMILPNWSRYHLLPQLGLALFVGAGLPYWLRDTRWRMVSPELSGPQVRLVKLLVLGCFLIQLPRAGFATQSYDPQQGHVLRLIEDIDARCRARHIDARTARAALGRLRFPASAYADDGWELLRGSDDPLPLSLEEARRLLHDESSP
jgi:hypothetical protein